MRTAVTEPSPMETVAAEKPRLNGFVVTLLAGWVILGTAAWFLARSRHMPASLALPVALAFLTEFSFYLASGFQSVRRHLSGRFSRPSIAIAMWAAALLPYLLFAIPSGYFDLPRFAALSAIMGAVAWWFIPARHAARDLAFLVLLGAVILSGTLKWIFPEIQPKLPMEVLGHITLARCAYLAVLLVRGAPDLAFGFIPKPREATIGILWFLPCAAIALPLGLQFGQLRPLAEPLAIWKAIGLFLGFLWVVALSEEFFFRALLQRWIGEWTQSRAAALISASLFFGACHLGMHRAFPNWRYAILAAILGFCCGAAYLQTRSIRSSMVTHALAATAVKVFFS